MSSFELTFEPGHDALDNRFAVAQERAQRAAEQSNDLIASLKSLRRSDCIVTDQGLVGLGLVASLFRARQQAARPSRADIEMRRDIRDIFKAHRRAR